MAREFDHDQFPEHTTRSLAPEPKVYAGTAAGAASVIVVWILSLTGVDMPDWAAAALATLLASGAAYLKRNGDRGV